MYRPQLASDVNVATPFPAYTAFAEIDFAKLRNNVRTLARLAAPASLMAVVKANAYGHGAVRIASALEEEGVGMFMTATLAEALDLRLHGLSSPVLVASPPHTSNLPVFRRHNLHISITSTQSVRDVLLLQVETEPLYIHLKIDTGMGRLGVTPEEAQHLIPELLQHPSIRLESLWTHLATAMHPDKSFARAQLDALKRIFDRYADRIPAFHGGNGGALLNLPEYVGLYPNEWVRVGGALLGLAAVPGAAEAAGLQPIMSLKSRILQLKTVEKGATISYGREWTAPEARRIATVGVGYADGYPSRLSDTAYVLVNGRPYPVAGRVCMDMLMIDLGPPSTTNESIAVNDEVTLFGPSFPELYRLAELSGKKAYEICCNISPRVPRICIETHHAPGRRIFKKEDP